MKHLLDTYDFLIKDAKWKLKFAKKEQKKSHCDREFDRIQDDIDHQKEQITLAKRNKAKLYDCMLGEVIRGS